jgi:hypothetical protein
MLCLMSLLMAHFPFWYFLFKTYISLYYLPTCNKKSSSPHIASYLRVSSRVKLSNSSLSSAQSRELLRTSPRPSKLSSTIVPIVPYRFPHSIDIANRLQLSPRSLLSPTRVYELLRDASQRLRTTSDYLALLRTASRVSPTFHHTSPYRRLTTVTLRPPRTLPLTCVIPNRPILGHLFGFPG